MSQISLTPSLQAGQEERAVSVLSAYFAPLDRGGFTGGRFDSFDPQGDAAQETDRFTAADLVAVGLLSVAVPARAALQLLESRQGELALLLEGLGPDRDFTDEPSVSREVFAPAWDLWWTLSSIEGLGPTTVSKLMARKRPRLIPIFDSVIDHAVLGGSGILWEPLHAALNGEEAGLRGRLVAVRDRVGLGHLSELRVFDVLAWMDGSGWADRVLALR
jgi:hypothetical protein